MANLKATVHSGCADYVFLGSGLMVATVSGVITPDVLAGLVSAGNAHSWLVALVDYRRSIVALSEAALFRLMPPGQCRPLALVVTSEQAPVFGRHAWECAKAGAVRRVFVDTPVEARSWAERQAGLRAQEQLAQARRGPSSALQLPAAA